MVEIPGRLVASNKERSVGPLLVAVAADKADALGAALGSKRTGWVPTIFPISWMTLPEIRTAVLAMADRKDGLLLHETQSFECLAPLRPGRDYQLMAIIQAQDLDPPRLSLQGEVRDADTNVCARFQCGLRILPQARDTGCSDA